MRQVDVLHSTLLVELDSFTTLLPQYLFIGSMPYLVINVLLLDYRCNKEMCVISVISSSTVCASKSIQGLAL